MPTSFLVRSLNSLVKAAMFTPCWPRAGPTGGAGVALPAGICSFTYPVTFCATKEHLHLKNVVVWRNLCGPSHVHAANAARVFSVVAPLAPLLGNSALLVVTPRFPRDRVANFSVSGQTRPCKRVLGFALRCGVSSPAREFGASYSLAGSTWSSSSSTGVSRPNMDTTTRTLLWSRSISSTVPRKDSRAPSVMRTVSPS